ncbi:MAG TPA: UDP-N-acetylmuramoyl-L-alanyl-D-glutamate--2,6-diaminopimelate ligase [Anaerolineae bacterium]|nr:UDP-N-acetylmuramoyl-L-alanyl-D-glutamate--2,6-diaminopimelate ligase [Anaerolineae bacterium]
MQLAQLLRPLNIHSAISSNSIEITLITANSRAVIPSALFVAYPGVSVDGAQFIPDAIQRGAAAIVTQTPYEKPAPVPIFRVDDGRAALAQLSAAWYNYPTRNLRVIGVTGTDGKTTTSTLIENILLAAGHTVGTITTVAAHIGGSEVDTGFHTTTPDAPEIQKYLAQMVEMGTEYAVVESTSHGLAQHRLDAVDFDVAVATNITHEHLDIHGSWENYRDAKAMLFKSLSTSRRKPRTAKVAVLNADDNTRGVFDFLRAIPCDERVCYTTADRRPPTDEREIWINAHDIEHSTQGLRFVIATPFGEITVESPLIGRYNVSNILAATGAALGRRIPFDAITQGVKITHGIVGRMERIEQGQDFTVIVDFAHTPYALESALKTVRELTQGKVIVLFGCAGLRDVQKRAWMGEIAGQLADLVVVTAEDPRTESLASINAQIAEGLHKANRVQGRDYFIVDDRAAAIDFAINELAQPGDLVILCGKGHERSMCYGTTEFAWSDQDAAREALRKRGQVQ